MLYSSRGAGRELARLAREPNRFLATIQIGITLAGFLASAAAAVSLAAPLEEPLSFLGRAAEPVSVVVVTLILAYVTLVFGELAPKRVAMQRAERWGLLAARPLAAMSTITRPAVWFLSKSTDVAVRLMGGNPDQQREEVTEEEIRDMVAMQTTFTDKQRTIIDGAFEISERTLREVLRPRNEVVFFRADQTCVEALASLVESGYSRAPVTATASPSPSIRTVPIPSGRWSSTHCPSVRACRGCAAASSPGAGARSRRCARCAPMGAHRSRCRCSMRRKRSGPTRRMSRRVGRSTARSSRSPINCSATAANSGSARRTRSARAKRARLMCGRGRPAHSPRS